MPELSELIVFALALIAAGVVSGLLAGLFGVGGGAILVPVFYQVYGLLGVSDAVRTHVAVGTSLAIIVPTSIRSFRAHKARGAVDLDVLRGWALSIPVGVVAAALIAAYVSGAELRGIFAVLSMLIAIRMFLNRQSWRLGDDLPKGAINAGAGFGIGLFSGLMGVGGGVLSNLWMTLFGRSVHQSVATASGVGVLISIPGLIGYVWAGWGEPFLPPFSTGFVNWITVALVMPMTLIVAPYGVRLAHALDKRQLEIGFGLFLTVVSIRFFVSLL